MKQSEPSTSTSQAGKEFSASKGWLTGLLKRNALHNIKITEESATENEGAAKIFPEELAKIIEDGDYSADQVVNADETGLHWKKLPNRTCIAKDEKTASGHKASKDRVTLLLCSNASGDRMLKPLLINKSLRPRPLKDKDLKQLPVHRMANPKSWMATAIFTEWFNNCFVPEVETYMKEKSLDFKVLLIVDNAASHPQLEHPNVQLVFLPPNTTSLIQPLDQGIIATLKKNYIKAMTATAGSDVVQSGRPIFDDFFQHLWPYIGNNTTNVVFQMGSSVCVAYPHRPMTLHRPTENSLAVLNHKILEANSQVQNVKLGDHQTCLSINRLWHELCGMLRRLVVTTAPGHHDCSIQE
ncbi:tigger transposable element-derived protein 1 [Trichonephila clavipes]|nr:tigger transposable element-derived protein 1 [Trichonephila clavipes]